MAKRTDWLKQLNDIDSWNVEYCEMLTSSHKLEDFFTNEPYLISIFKNYRSRRLNELTLFWCFIITFMHWSCETKLYDKEKLDYINVKLYGILRGDSVSHKSGYIKPIREAFDFVERYFKETFTDSNKQFNTTCIESLTAAKLLAELEASSKFVSSDEDRPLTDFAFFEPNSPKAKETHPSLISAFNGVYKLQRSTMTYCKEIRERSLTILVPTTGDRWPSLLQHFYDSYQTNGLYERFLYWTIGKKNFVQEISSFNNELPSLEYLYITRMLIGSRIYEYDDEALNYLRPILSDMRSNRELHQGLFNVPQNKRAEACQRRGADLIERIAAVFQNIFDTLKVLQPVKSIQFDRIQKNTLDEIKTNIASVFYSNDTFTEVDDDLGYPDGIDLKDLAEVQITSLKKAPLQSMKIELSAAKAAVHFFHKVLLPQSIQLFCTGSIDTKKNSINELKIIQHSINCFSISDLTHNSIFHNFKRDNIDVKEVLLNLEKKHLFKRGKFVKVGSRLIESWIKILPEPTNDEQIRWFQNELNNSYQLELEKYIAFYEDGIDQKPSSSLTEASERILLTQRSWIEQLRRKLHSPAIQQNSSESTTCSSTKEMPQAERAVSFANVFQDIIDSFTHDTIDLNLQKTCSNTRESTDMIQHMDISPIIECCDEILMENNENVLDNNQLHESIIHDCLSDVTGRVADLVSAIDVTMTDPTTNKNISSIEISTKFTTLNDHIIPENMKMLCNRILSTNSIILSGTKLNKVSKTNMVDVHKACHLLIEHGLLSIETKMLANKFAYYESYMKKIPQDKSDLIDFSLTLAKFDILDINVYYETLKTIDTKNNTYLTPYGMAILKQKPYDHLKILVNEDRIMQPTKERYRKLFDMAIDSVPVDKENLLAVEAGEATNSEHELEYSISNTKRRRGLTGKGKEYEEQRIKSKKKKNDD